MVRFNHFIGALCGLDQTLGDVCRLITLEQVDVKVWGQSPFSANC